MATRGVRGATTVPADTKEHVLAATRELLSGILAANPGMSADDIASAFFTVTDDIVSVHPALAARQMGWGRVPLMCAREIPVPDSLRLCIRALIHWNTDAPQEQIRHVYLRDAAQLRPDLADQTQEKTR